MLDYLNKMSVGLWRSFLMVKEIFVPGENHIIGGSYIQHNGIMLF